MEADQQDKTLSDSEDSDVVVCSVLYSAEASALNLCGKASKEDKDETLEYKKTDEQANEDNPLSSPDDAEAQQATLNDDLKTDLEDRKDDENPEGVSVKEEEGSPEDQGLIGQEEDQGKETGIEKSELDEKKSESLKLDGVDSPDDQPDQEIEKLKTESGSEGEPDIKEAPEEDKSKKETSSLAEEDKTKDEEPKEVAEEKEPEKAKKKGGAMANVSRFLGKKLKKEKEQPDILDALKDVSLTDRDSEELSFSEEAEKIPPLVYQSVLTTKMEIQKVSGLIRLISSTLETRPRIVTCDMVKKAEELKQRILDLSEGIPLNIKGLDEIESSESREKCEKIYQVIGEELNAMNLIAETIIDALRKRLI